MIEIDGLVKWYGPTQALRGIAARLERGRVLGFLGPNGAGKSTTMKILTGYLLPDGGRASVGGHDVVADPTAAKRLVGYLPENNPLYHDMAVVDFLDFAARARGVAPADRRRRIAEAVAAVSLEEMFHKGVGELSKGYRQRVGLAQALVHNPDVLILDEPTSGLDPNQRAEILRLIRRIGREKTVIHSTHVLDEVRHTCDRILVIHRGRIVADGTPDEIVDQHQRERILRVCIDAPAKAVRAALEHLPGVVAVTDARQRAEQAGEEGDDHDQDGGPAAGRAGGSSRARRRRAGRKAAAPASPTREAEGPPTFVVRLKEGADCRRDIYHLARDKHWDLLELASERLSLDEVFKRLTAD